MNFNYDSSADTLDIRLGEALITRTEQVDGGTLVDLDEHGGVSAIEVIRPARRWPLEEILERFTVSEGDAKVLRSLWSEPRAFPFAEPSELGAGSDERARPGLRQPCPDPSREARWHRSS